MPDKPVIRCEHVTLGYGRAVVLRDLSLEISAGTFLPFLGPNGAGKTTLLRGILGLLKPLRGKIHTPFGEKPAGYVPQHKSVDPLFPLTVREIAAMGFYPRHKFLGRPNADNERLLETIFEELKLTEHAHKNYRDLSGGTKQKTLVARAFVSGADVFIMDEPTSDLDEASEQEVFHHLTELVTKHHKTVLVAHHGLNRLIRAAATSEVCLVHHGKVERISLVEVKQKTELFS